MGVKSKIRGIQAILIGMSSGAFLAGAFYLSSLYVGFMGGESRVPLKSRRTEALRVAEIENNDNYQTIRAAQKREPQKTEILIANQLRMAEKASESAVRVESAQPIKLADRSVPVAVGDFANYGITPEAYLEGYREKWIVDYITYHYEKAETRNGSVPGCVRETYHVFYDYRDIDHIHSHSNDDMFVFSFEVTPSSRTIREVIIGYPALEMSYLSSGAYDDALLSIYQRVLGGFIHFTDEDLQGKDFKNIVFKEDYGGLCVGNYVYTRINASMYIYARDAYRSFKEFQMFH